MSHSRPYVLSTVRSCRAGYIRNHVAGSVIYRQNSFADPDAGELVTNTVGGNMICLGNSPQVQIGDSEGSPNVVQGNALGECKNVVA